MSNFVEVQAFDNGHKITLNLDLVQSIVPVNYKDARTILSFPGIEGDPRDFYVTDSYEYLSRLAREGKSE